MSHERWLTSYPCWNKSYSIGSILPLADQTQTLQLTLAQTVMSAPSFATQLNAVATADMSAVPWPDAYTVTHLRGQILGEWQQLAVPAVTLRSYLNMGIVMDTAHSRGSQTIFNPAQYLDSQRHWKWLHHRTYTQSSLFNTFQSTMFSVDLDVPLGLRVSDLDRLSLCIAWWTTNPDLTDLILTPYLRLLATGVT